VAATAGAAALAEQDGGEAAPADPVTAVPAVERPVGYTPRRNGGLSSYERVLARVGLDPVIGIDEAGRGACAGPLVVAAVTLRGSRVAGLTELADSKALTAQARNRAFEQVMRAALDWSAVIIPAAEIDRLGLHVCNVAGMRRALARLSAKPGYVLTDGFPVRGLAAPALAMWKGDQVAACVAAASVVAKVTRDALMCELGDEYPEYGFSRHKGYSTRSHMKALADHGPCREHRRSFVNVRGSVLAAVEAGLDDAAEAGLDVGAEAGPGAGGELSQDLDVDPGLDVGIDLGAENSAAANSCYPPGSGQNGPIVDVIDEHGWPTAGLAATREA
jgi:ribonuclease HII